RRRSAARRARARCGRDLTLQRLHLLRVRAFTIRCRAFQAPRRRSATARQRGGCRSRRALNAVVGASVALASTPIAFGQDNIEELRHVGLSDAEIVDVINSAAFFNWANRLMSSLGEPTTKVGA